MLDVLKIGENTIHDDSFLVDRPNGHPCYLLILVKTPAEFYVNGSWIRTSANTAVLFQPGQKHLYRACQDSSATKGYMDDWMHITAGTASFFPHFPYGQPIVLHEASDYYSLFHLIHNEYYSSSMHRQSVISDLTTALLNKLASESNTTDYPDLYYELLRIREEIYRSPAKEWKISTLSDSLHLSDGYFHALYRQFFSTTCMSDVIASRIQYSCELLHTNKRSIEEIAELCGYHHTEHFIRQFKSVMNTTPAQYRRQVISPTA